VLAEAEHAKVRRVLSDSHAPTKALKGQGISVIGSSADPGGLAPPFQQRAVFSRDDASRQLELAEIFVDISSTRCGDGVIACSAADFCSCTKTFDTPIFTTAVRIKSNKALSGKVFFRVMEIQATDSYGRIAPSGAFTDEGIWGEDIWRSSIDAP
jgi:hypothetical protein